MPKVQNEPLTFEKVWAMFQETDRQMKEADRKFQKQMEESRRKVEEEDCKLREEMKETSRIVGELGNRFGELAEHLVLPGIMEKFNTLGFHFTRDAENVKFRDPKTNRPHTEVDILLENGDIVIAVEVKAKLSYQDVNDHLKRMEVLRRMADSREDKRKYRGAIAGAIVDEADRNYALKAGFYLLVQSGDTMKLDIPEGFVPREW